MIINFMRSARVFSSKLSGLRFFTSSGIMRGEQKKIDVLDVQINYEKAGNGDHPVLCLPGALGFIDSDFGPILPKFSGDKFTVVAWDPPGYGKSRPPNRDFSGGNQFFYRDAKYAHGLMQKLGFTKYSILGWSDGGNTGLIMSALYPDFVKKIIVWGANAYLTDEDWALYDNVRDIDKWSAKMKDPLLKMYGEDYFRKTWAEWLGAYEDIHRTTADIYKAELPRIRCPTLVIHGLKDTMVPTFHAEYIHKNVTNSKLHLMPEGKHNLHLRYADEFIPLVESFLMSK